jgi:hypothetical protein
MYITFGLALHETLLINFKKAYKLTARINARAYFETSAVTMEGLDLLFNYVAQIAVR